MPRAACIDTDTGKKYIFIDRIFMAQNPFSRTISYMWGFRNFIPQESNDGKKGIVHGSSQTVYALIK